MKKIFLLLMSFSLVSLYAQVGNYQTVYSHRISFFNDNAIKIDSVKFEGNDSVFYPIKQIREQVDDWCYTPYGASFLGEKIVIKDNWNYFFNGRGDTIKIKTDAVLNESFELFHIENTVTATATVISHKVQEFFGLSDSVKTIEIRIVDGNGNPPTFWPPRENPTIQISQNYGFLRIFNLYDFFHRYSGHHPAWHPCSLLGLTNPAVGEQNLTWFEVFDFQPGDEFHTRIEEMWNHDIVYYTRNVRTIDKYLSRTDYGNDSIVYEMLRTQHSVIWQRYGSTNETLSSHNVKIVIRPNVDFDRLVGESIIDSDYWGWGHGAFTMRGSSSVKSIPISNMWLYNQHWEDEGCWDYLTYDGPMYYENYQRGLGGPYYFDYDFNYGTTIRELVFYRKGDVTWGTPLVITNIENVEKDESVILFPNPVRDILQIKFTEFKNSPVFQLIDLQGRLLMEKELETNANFIDLSALADGMYLYRITEAGQIVSNGKILKSTN